MFGNYSSISVEYKSMRITRRTVKLAKLGNQKAFEEIYFKYANYLAAFIDSFVNDDSLAEDIVMDMMVNLINSLNKYNFKDEDFESWLFKMAKNKSLEAIRKKYFNVETSLDTAIELGKDAFVIEYDGFNILELKKELTGDEYRIIVLKYILGFNLKEISNIMDISLSKSKHIICNAYEKIKKIVRINYK